MIMTTTNATTSSSRDPYKVSLTPRFLVVTMAVSVVFSFALGSFARQILVHSHLLTTSTTRIDETCTNMGTGTEQKYQQQKSSVSLPSPILSKNTKVPNTIYTSKHFDTERIEDKEWVKVEDKIMVEEKEKIEDEDDDDGDNEEDDDDDEDEAETHEPAGQHLLVDIKNVDFDFLNSEDLLARAMVDLIQNSGLTTLSYHCHKLNPTGVSCAGILLESHISLHTWPLQGVITLYLFTFGSKALIPLVSIIEQIFGVPSSSANKDKNNNEQDPPRMMWSFKRRGFPQEAVINQGLNDKYNYFLGSQRFAMKKQIERVQTNYQEILVYDVIDPRFQSYDSYKKSIQQNMQNTEDDDNKSMSSATSSSSSTYESMHPELFLPDRMVYLDGVMQSRRYGEAAYHEALVHPALFAHDNPVSVAIIGGGEGATLREVLKHNTVKRAVMVEIDEGWDDIARNSLPEWTDCSSLEGSTPHCFDDPRVELYYEDAIKWFMDRYPSDVDLSEEDKFDIIIMDALDPGDNVEFSEILFANDELLNTFHRALSDDGMFISQTGESNYIDDPREMMSNDRQSAIFLDKLQQRFITVKYYEESHCQFLGVWGFFVAMKSHRTIANWYKNEPEINLAMQKRGMATKTGGKSPFKYFDGSTMQSYQYPSKPVEAVFCRKDPKPEECYNGHGFDPEITNVPLSAFKPKLDKNNNTTAAVHAVESITEGSYVAIEQCVHNIHIPDSTMRLIEEAAAHPELGSLWYNLSAFIDQYSYPAGIYGPNAREMNPTLMRMSLGHYHDNNIDDKDNKLTTNNASSSRLSFVKRVTEGFGLISGLADEGGYEKTCNPALLRNYRTYICAQYVASRNVETNEKVR